MVYHDIIKGCIKNQRKAQTAFYNEYLTVLSNTALRYATSQQDAKDIIQKSFVKIFKSGDALNRSEDHLINWMRRIVINTAINHKRARDNYNKHIDANDYYILHQETTSNKIEDERLIHALKNIRPIFYEIISLIAIDGYSHKEAAALLGIEEGSSRGRYSRAIQAIKSHINHLTEDN